MTALAEQKLDRVLRDKQTLDKQRQDRLISSVSQTLTTAVNTKLDKVVKSEMKNNVLPCEWVEEVRATEEQGSFRVPCFS